MPGSTHERILAAEWLAVMAVETLDALSGADSAPSRSRPGAVLRHHGGVLMLAAAAMFGEQPGKLAAAFGGVAGLAIVFPRARRSRRPWSAC